MSFFLGGYSDKAGRKYAILPGICGILIRTGIYSIVSVFGLSVWWMLLGAFLDGFGGGYRVLLGGCKAYLADITSPEQRLFRMTVADLCMHTSAVIAPVGIGFWIQSGTFTGPYILIMSLMIVGILYTVFLVPETVVPLQKVPFFTMSHLKNSFAFFLVKDQTTPVLNRRKKFALLLTVLAIGNACLAGSTTSMTLFQMNEPLCWGSVLIGIYSMYSVALSSVGATVAARLMRLCARDETIAVVAVVAAMLEKTYTGFAQTMFMMFFGE